MAPRKNNFWTLETESTLIMHFESNRLLWDPKDPDHKFAKRSVAIDTLAMLFDYKVTVEEIWARFESLRSTFRSNHRMAMATKSGSGADEVFVPSWAHYKALLFLADTYTPRPSKGTPIGDIDGNAASTSNSPIREEHTPERSTSSSAASDPLASTSAPLAAAFNGTKRRRESYDTGSDMELLSIAKEALTATQNQYTAWATHAGLALANMIPFNATLAMSEMDTILIKYHSDNPNNPNKRN